MEYTIIKRALTLMAVKNQLKCSTKSHKVYYSAQDVVIFSSALHCFLISQSCNLHPAVQQCSVNGLCFFYLCYCQDGCSYFSVVCIFQKGV